MPRPAISPTILGLAQRRLIPWLVPKFCRLPRLALASRVGHSPQAKPWPGSRRLYCRASLADIDAAVVDDTIYALSTAPGRAALAVIRISGPSCLDVYRALCPSKGLPKPRRATVRALHEPSSPEARNEGLLDPEALVLYFPAPNTVTGEDVLELHVHGGPATVRAVLAAIPKCGQRIRYAEPGEFTRRAFFNVRLDLSQIEALGDGLAAETEQQRRAAMSGQSGVLGRTYEMWRQLLLLARGEIEALIDFSEDQHLDRPPAEMVANVKKQVAAMLQSIHSHELAGQRSELLRKGIRIALVGPPNVGKSSLMNRIVGREASIVSTEAGTTRDVVEVKLDIGGYLCSFADTAGLRTDPSCGSTVGRVEEEGIRRAKHQAKEADLVLALASIEMGPQGPYIHHDQEALRFAAEAPLGIIVVNKKDLATDDLLASLLGKFEPLIKDKGGKPALAKPIAISCCGPEGEGIDELVTGLTGCFSRMTGMPTGLDDLVGVTERQRQLLAKCRRHLDDFMAEVGEAERQDAEPDAVLAAEYLRYAADTLARITGRGAGGDAEEVLGVVFSRFCVGK